MANLTIDPKTVAPVESYEQDTGPAGDVFEAGTFVHRDATSGRWVKALADTAANSAGRIGIALTKASRVGVGITVIHRGVVNVGEALAALAPEAQIFLSNSAGLAADAAGTVSKPLGTVTTGWTTTGQFDRLLRMNV